MAFVGTGIEFQGVEKIGAGEDEEADGDAFGGGSGEISQNAGGRFDGSRGNLAVHGEVDGGAAAGATADDGDVGELGEICFCFGGAVLQQPFEEGALVVGERADVGNGCVVGHAVGMFYRRARRKRRGKR